ncbi:plasmid stabilization protein [Thiocystis minor]|uniref:type II toxin-antitoxin system RelE/ParE family toxin n=1 Tax=Thiocystis minor TaxID=61597 RepID=UPI001914097C|nr:type II toxin-antitoxin system RelE/ParE family toxin [Thiocystis minor]MBK5966211.1 plasmid stabilization protein [Thiocystis minor]
MTRPVYTAQPKRDLNAIGLYIVQDNPHHAVSFIRELRAQCRKIAQAPQAYRQRPELGVGIRACAHGNYVIFFMEDGRVVRIIRVLHGALDIDAHFGNKKIPDLDDET